MATKTLNDFTLAGAAASDDFIVGFDTAVAGGERKWTVATIANAVSGVMTPELNNSFFNSTDTIPISRGGTGQTTAFASLVALGNGGASSANGFLKVNSSNTGLTYANGAVNIFSAVSSAVNSSYTGNGSEVLQITLQSTPTATNSLVHLSLFWDKVEANSGYIKVYRNATQESWRFSPGLANLDNGGSINDRVTWIDYVTTAGPHTYTVFVYGAANSYLNTQPVTITNLQLEIATIY